MENPFRIFLVLAFCVCASAFASSPAPSDEEAAVALYKARCAACHGEDGRPKGIAKNAAVFTDEAWKNSTSLDEVARVISQGRSKMPGFASKLTPEEIRALAAYVLAMKSPS